MVPKRDKPSWKLYFQTPLAFFLLKGLALFLIWDLIIYPYVISGTMHSWMIHYLVEWSSVTLHWFFPHTVANNSELYINGVHCVHVGIPCNGIEAMGVFSCIVLAFNTHWYHKLWLLMISYGVIFILNAMRIAALAILVVTQNKQAVDISHKYIFNVLLYVVLLFLFWLWSIKFGKKAENEM